MCCICGKMLPNRWAVARRVSAGGATRCFCHLHANENFPTNFPATREKGLNMTDNEDRQRDAARAQELARAASGEQARKAWSECSSLASRLGGGIKALWAKVHPDRSPTAMLSALDADLAENARRLAEVKPALDKAYAEIVAKKREYQGAAPVRQRLLKVELQTLMSRYKSLEREFGILCENERSIEMVRGRFLEVLAHGMRGALDADLVDRLADDVEGKVDEAEDVQDALGDLERAGRRRVRAADDFDAELAGFDGELGLSAATDVDTQNKEAQDEQTDIGGDSRIGDFA